LQLLDARKTELNPWVRGFNALAQGVTGVADSVNNVKADQWEQKQYRKALQPVGYENMEKYGLNGNPVFTKFGGEVPTYQVGGLQKPQGDAGTFQSQAPKEATGYDLLNYVISGNVDPYKAVPGANGTLGSAYGHLESSLGTDNARELFSAAKLFQQDANYQKMKPEERINNFYSTPSSNPKLQALKDKIKNYTGTGSAVDFYRSSPQVSVQGQYGNGIAATTKPVSQTGTFQTGGDANNLN
jgi:hypothetical protein